MNNLDFITYEMKNDDSVIIKVKISDGGSSGNLNDMFITKTISIVEWKQIISNFAKLNEVYNK